MTGARLVMLATALLAVAAPGAAAQGEVDVCAGQPIPAGYVVVATYRSQQCPAYYDSPNPNQLRLRVPGDSVTVCSAFPPGLRTHVVVGAYRTRDCPGYFASPDPNAHAMRVPGDSVTVCTAFPSALQTHVVVGAYRTRDCPGYFASPDPNAHAMRVPSDTVTACAQYTPSLAGYVVVAQFRTQGCPGYYAGPQPNAISFRRMPGTVVPPVSGDAMAVLSRHERLVFRTLRAGADERGLGAPTHRVWTGGLGEGETSSATLIPEGVRYVLLAACDGDCGGLEVSLWDGANRVAGLATADREAAVEIPTTVSGRWQVRLSMVDCAVAPCRFGVAIHRAPQAGMRRPPPRRRTLEEEADRPAVVPPPP